MALYIPRNIFGTTSMLWWILSKSPRVVLLCKKLRLLSHFGETLQFTLFQGRGGSFFSFYSDQRHDNSCSFGTTSSMQSRNEHNSSCNKRSNYHMMERTHLLHVAVLLFFCYLGPRVPHPHTQYFHKWKRKPRQTWKFRKAICLYLIIVDVMSL